MGNKFKVTKINPPVLAEFARKVLYQFRNNLKIHFSRECISMMVHGQENYLHKLTKRQIPYHDSELFRIIYYSELTDGWDI